MDLVMFDERQIAVCAFCQAEKLQQKIPNV
jgi:hypothetical protein